MKLSNYRAHVESFFNERDILVSDNAMRVFTSRRFLNRELLLKMSDEEVVENLRSILNDTLRLYRQRAERYVRPTPLRYVDVMPAIRARFCKLPPFCRAISKY